MFEQLIIGEKPSVGRDIAAAIDPGHARCNGYLECNGGSIAVSWAAGHLFDTADPQDYEAAWAKWDAGLLPMVPARWKRKLVPRAADQFRVLEGLLKQARMVIHAGDSDREGQLIIDEILEEAGYRGPVKRLWLNENNPAGIRKALGAMKDGTHYRGMSNAALARQRSDWLVGINATRAFTLRGRQQGADALLSVGRVQTPTLALVVQRDIEIENFKPRDYFTISAAVAHVKGGFRAAWVAGDAQNGLDEEGRLVDAQIAKVIAGKLKGRGSVTFAETAPKKEPPPKGYSLLKLQVEASSRFGYTAQRTLDAAQALYEKHKITSYPRTDCEYFPENDHSRAAKVLVAIKHNDADLARGAAKADSTRKSATWNDKQVAKSAHYAIMPVAHTVDPDTLSPVERNIYRLVALNYVAQFHPDREYEQRRIEAEVQGEKVVATGIRELKPGWRDILGKEDGGEGEQATADAESQDAQLLPDAKVGDSVEVSDAKVEAKQTKAPPYFTEGTLLKAMSSIAKYVTDKTMRALLRDSDGIGTAATQGPIIETLKDHDLLEVKADGKGKAKKPHLRSTTAGRQLIAVVPQQIKDPVLTALFERAMQEIEKGEKAVDTLLSSATDLARLLVGAAASAEIGMLRGKNDVTCPCCGQGVLRRRNGKSGPFWACNRYPDCKTTFPDARGKPDLGGKEGAAPRRESKTRQKE